jgi:hypothetical protein
MGAAAARRLEALALLAGVACSQAWAQVDEPAWVAAAPLAMEARAVPSLALDLSTPVGAPPGQGGTQPLDLGLRWRQPLRNEQHVDITAWQRMSSPPDALTLVRSREPVYGARVEMKISGRRSGFMADHGFLGLQLDSGSRIMLRRKDGNPTLYYRSRF